MAFQALAVAVHTSFSASLEVLEVDFALALEAPAKEGLATFVESSAVEAQDVG